MKFHDMHKKTSKTSQVIFCRNRIAPKNKIRSQTGFSLLETMIATLVISIGMLGIAGLQLVSMKGSQQSYMRHQATFVAQDLLERMRANSVGVKAQNYVFESDTGAAAPNCAVIPAANCAVADCTVQQLATYDIHSVACKMGGGLSNGKIQVVCEPIAGGCVSGQVGIQVSWQERQLGKEANTTIAATADGLFPNDANRTDSIILYTRID